MEQDAREASDLYGGEDKKKAVGGCGFDFTVADVLFSTGSISHLAMGPSVHKENYLSTQLSLDVVATVGSAQTSALCVFRRGIRPVVASTFDLPDVTLGMWSIHCDSTASYSSSTTPTLPHQPLPETCRHHKFIIISKQHSSSNKKYSMVLEAGEELCELERGAFVIDQATIGAASMFGDSRMVQVYEGGILLLDVDGERVQRIELDEGEEEDEMAHRVGACQIAGFYVVLLLLDGSMKVFLGNESTRLLEEVILPRSLKVFSLFTGARLNCMTQDARIASFCLHQNSSSCPTALLDHQQAFKYHRAMEQRENVLFDGRKKAAVQQEGTQQDFDIDDFELYGEQLMQELSTEAPPADSSQAISADETVDRLLSLADVGIDETIATWLVVLSDAGIMEVLDGVGN